MRESERVINRAEREGGLETAEREGELERERECEQRERDDRVFTSFSARPVSIRLGLSSLSGRTRAAEATPSSNRRLT